MMCEGATRLLVAYRAALAEYDRVRCATFQTLAPEHITLQEAAHAREDAQISVTRARRAYWKHVDEHACRRLVVARPTIGIAGSISLHL
jgi:hypothetical protein